MSRYMRALLDGDGLARSHVLSAAATRAMHRRLYGDRRLATDLAHLFFDGTLMGHEFRAHSGGTTTFKSNLALYPQLHLGVFVAVNSDDGGSRLADTLHQRLVAHFFPTAAKPDVPQPPADARERWGRYAGTYETTVRSYTRLDKLFEAATRTVSVDSDGFLVIAHGRERSRYLETAPRVFRRIDGDLTDVLHQPVDYVYFKVDDGGAAMLTMPASDFQRIPFYASRSFLALSALLAVALAFATLALSWTRWVRAQTSDTSVRRVRWLSILLSLTVLGTAGAAVSIAMVPATFSEVYFDWPGRLLPVLYGILAIASCSTVGALALVPLWLRSSSSLALRGCYSLFLATCLLLVAALWSWNLVGLNY